MTPVTLERFRPLVKRTDRLGIRSIEHAAPVAAHVDEAHLEQYPQMLRDRGLLHPQPVHNLPHRALLQGDKVQNLPAPWLCHRIKCIRSCRCPCHASTIHSYIGICQALFFAPKRTRTATSASRDSDGSSTLSRGEFQWSLFLIGFPGRHAITVAPFSLSAAITARLSIHASLLPREGEFAGGVTLLKSSHLAVLYDELPNVIRELRRPEREPLDGDQLLGRSAGKGQRETSAGLVEHLELDLGRSDVVSR